MSKTQNLSLKFNNIDTANFSTETIEVGKDKNKIHMLRYKGKSLHATYPIITITQYGLPPGEILSNGTPNKYWKEDSNRNSIRLPLDVSIPEIAEYVEKAQEIDTWFENNDAIKKQCGVPKKAIYNGLFREPAKATDTKGETRLPYTSLKFDVDFKSGAIKTDFYVHQPDGTFVEMEEPTIEKLEEVLRLGSKIQPVGEFVKVYVASSAAGGWGPTLKAQAIRVWPSERTERKREKASFVDDDDQEEEDEPVAVPQKVAAKSAPKPSVADSDEESDDEPVQVTKGSTKKVAQVDSDDSDEESDNESEEEVKPVVKAKISATKAQVKAPAKGKK